MEGSHALLPHCVHLHPTLKKILNQLHFAVPVTNLDNNNSEKNNRSGNNNNSISMTDLAAK